MFKHNVEENAQTRTYILSCWLINMQLVNKITAQRKQGFVVNISQVKVANYEQERVSGH